MKFLLLCFIVVLCACTTAPTSDEWPPGMPSLAYLQEYYARDEAHQKTLSQKKYLNWVYRFYEGWELYSRGWFQATDELVESLQAPSDKLRGRELMESIGYLIAPEWSKNDPYRVVNTRHVALWGNVILDAMVNDNQFPVLTQIHSDVEQLLAGEITPEQIIKSRYMVEEVFGGDNDNDF